MTTDKQIAANRDNSQLSTGPRTLQGKARTAQNPTKHGLFSQRDVIRPEEQVEFKRFRAAWLRHSAAATPREFVAALNLMRAAWRLERCAITEAALIDDTCLNQLDPIVDPRHENTMRSIDRAHGKAMRRYAFYEARLREYQTERKFQEISAKNPTIDPRLGFADSFKLLKDQAGGSGASTQMHLCEQTAKQSQYIYRKRRKLVPGEPRRWGLVWVGENGEETVVVEGECYDPKTGELITQSTEPATEPEKVPNA